VWACAMEGGGQRLGDGMCSPRKMQKVCGMVVCVCMRACLHSCVSACVMGYNTCLLQYL